MTPRIALAMGVGTVVGAMLISLVAFSSGTGVAAEYPTGELLAWIDDFDERLGLVEDQAVRIDERNASLRTVVGGLQVAALEADANSLSEAVSFLLVEQEQSALAQRQDRNRWRLVAQYATAARAFNVGLGTLYYDPSYAEVVAEEIGQAVSFDVTLTETWTAAIANEMPVEVFGQILHARLFGALEAAINAPAPKDSNLSRTPVHAFDSFAGY